jgi:hypothetical protein
VPVIRILVIAMVAACSSRPPELVANHSTTPPPPPKPMTIDSSPGPLARSHEALDLPNGCNACHAGTTFAIDANLCLGCHEHAGMRARIAAGRGFHASRVVRGRPCELCHLDHKGRAFDLMGWKAMPGGMTGFDHELAGWKLEGNHARMPCGSCHTATNKQGLRTFVGLESTCASCHAKDQPHGLDPVRGECGRCHAQAGWKPVKPALAFDHDSASDARVPLASMHVIVPCAKCHPNGVFVTNVPDPGACERCHASRSPHGTRFDAFGTPPACATCHRASWRARVSARATHEVPAAARARDGRMSRLPSRIEARRLRAPDRGAGDVRRLSPAPGKHGPRRQVQRRTVPAVPRVPDRAGAAAEADPDPRAEQSLPARERPQGRAVQRLPREAKRTRQGRVRRHGARMRRLPSRFPPGIEGPALLDMPRVRYLEGEEQELAMTRCLLGNNTRHHGVAPPECVAAVGADREPR